MSKLTQQDNAKTSIKTGASRRAFLRPSQGIGVMLLAALGWSLGGIPSIQPNLGVTFTNSANAQALSPKALKYVDAVFEIETLRLKYWNTINRLMDGKSMPDKKCYAHDLRPDVKETCQEFINRCLKIIKKHQLTPKEFNEFQEHRNKKTPLGQQLGREIQRRRQQLSN